MAMKRSLRLLAALPALLTLVACEASKSSNPLSPSVAGPIAGVQITEPKVIEPAFEFKFKESQQPIRLVVENSVTTGVRPVTYAFEVASDSDFNNKVYARSGVPQGDGGRTSVTIERLDLGRTYYWRARGEDGANTSTYARASFEVLPKALLNAPPQQSPTGGATTPTRRPEMIVGQSERNTAIGFVRYEFQISSNVSFTAIVASGMRDEGGGTTGFLPDGDLEAATTHYWRVRATDGETTSNWSGAESFRTAAAPAPGPGPSPGPTNPGGPCNSSNPDDIVKCERAKYSGFMSGGQILEFLKASARSLNRNGIGGGPFGILRKTSGHNCSGYSCDILCAGQGTAQRQTDVLGDADGAQIAGWGGTITWPQIRIDVCEIQ
jgi:hypothetical protein